MKIYPITNNKNYTGLKPNKTINAAYSAVFSLSLLSAIAGGASLTKDTYTPNNTEKSELRTLDKPAVIKAQTIYKDSYGNRWVPYEDYRQKYREYAGHKEYIDIYKRRITEDTGEINKFNGEIQELSGYINEAEEAMPQIIAKSEELKQTKEDIEEYYSLLEDSNLEFGAIGVVSGILLGLISRGLFNLYNNVTKRKK